MALKSTLVLSALTLTTALIIYSCKKEKTLNSTDVVERPLNLPATPFDYASKHHINSHVATLGRVLFYDVNLSLNNSTSCGSCHKQEFAFANNLRFDKGFDGKELTRNTPSIQDLRGTFRNNNSNVNESFTPTTANQNKLPLFWDGRQNNLSNMVLNPVLNHNEMNISDFNLLVKKVSSLTYYPQLFKNAYGSTEVSIEKIALSLQAFVQCLNNDVTNTSSSFPFGTNPSNTQLLSQLNDIEKYGHKLFHEKYNCAQCHDPSNNGTYGTESSFGQENMFNIGLDLEYTDKGLGAVTNNTSDVGHFKVPTLKNISLTAPYMHDGRFNSLEEVLDHYSDNIKLHPNLSSKFINIDGSLKNLDISSVEKQAIIAFLKKLVDKDFLTSPLYSDPFKK